MNVGKMRRQLARTGPTVSPRIAKAAADLREAADDLRRAARWPS